MTKKRTERHRDFWYQGVLDMIKSYTRLEDEKSEMTLRYKKAIDDAFDYFDKFDYGAELKRAIYMRYIKGTHTIYGIAVEMNVSADTVRRWCERFVRKVADYVGLPKRD